MKVILKNGVKFRVTKSEAEYISDLLLKGYNITVTESGKTFILSEIVAII